MEKKTDKLDRRDFLKTASVVGVGMMSPLAACASIGNNSKKLEGTWKKCALHNHTLWSDGKAMPEGAVLAYKENGFDAYFFTDHNIFPKDKHHWRDVMREAGSWPYSLTKSEVSYTAQKVKKIDSKRTFGREFVRLKNYEEVAAELAKEGEFLVLPGEEITAQWWTKDANYECHINIFNTTESVDAPKATSVGELIGKCFEVYRGIASRTNRPTFAQLNHPFWRLWDNVPADVLKYPEITHFEVCNNCIEEGPEDMMSAEKFWDILLAHRVEDGQGVIYGTATDDNHSSAQNKIIAPGTVGNAWVMANVNEEFTNDNLVRALARGDFYSSTGVSLKKVEFDSASKTLSVEVDAKEGENYTIDFITTKRGFSRAYTEKKYPTNSRLIAHSIPYYSDEIGKTVKSVKGTVASYTMSADDLYVRAIVHSDVETKLYKNMTLSGKKCFMFPQFECAWVQPFENKRA